MKIFNVIAEVRTQDNVIDLQVKEMLLITEPTLRVIKVKEVKT